MMTVIHTQRAGLSLLVNNTIPVLRHVGKIELLSILFL